MRIGETKDYIYRHTIIFLVDGSYQIAHASFLEKSLKEMWAFHFSFCIKGEAPDLPQWITDIHVDRLALPASTSPLIINRLSSHLNVTV